MPSHRRMRAVDRDLIRGGHYGQRSCEPHLKAEHMAAPTKPATRRFSCQPGAVHTSTHGTFETCSLAPDEVRLQGKTGSYRRSGQADAIDPKRSCGRAD